MYFVRQLSFYNFILADDLFATALRRFETCVLVNNNSSGELVSSLESPIIFDERFKLTWVPSFIPDFNLLSCELDDFTFTVLHWVIYIDIILKQNKILFLSQVLLKNLK